MERGVSSYYGRTQKNSRFFRLKVRCFGAFCDYVVVSWGHMPVCIQRNARNVRNATNAADATTTSVIVFPFVVYVEWIAFD